MNDADEWIRIDAVCEALGVKASHAATTMREAGVRWRRRAAAGRSYEYRLADVLALKQLRPEAKPPKPPKPTKVRPVYRGPDYCDHEGAQRLAERIERYWRERGATPTVEIVSGGYVQVMRSARFDLRSDMLNGLPRKSVGKPK